MKLFTTILLAAGFLLGSLLHAQPGSERLNVRFATPVVVGENKIPAGNCEIQVMRGNSDSIILVLRPESGSAVSVLANHFDDSTTAVSDAGVVLDRRGDNTYHLSQILFSDHTGYRVAAE